MQDVLDSIADGVVVAARDGRFLFFNPAAERILGIFGGVAEAYGQDRQLARMLVRVSMERMVCPEPDASRSGLYRMVVEAIRHGQAHGEFRRDLAPDAVFGVVASVFMGTLIWWVGGGPHQEIVARSNLSLHDAVEQQLSIAFDGIRAPAAAGLAE